MAEVEVGELAHRLGEHLDRVRGGEELTVTDRGRAVARIVPVERPRAYDRLVAEGVIEPSTVERRTRLVKRVKADGSVGELIADQRR